ncbi:TonB-linked outer membrane protein, SusC/RagA family [Bacteroidetes bacterium oral taxon 272 str. F0290]|nr:TonB-linked outer membrane protein, SusC/RagA family [Bacteroidetes bacterium oral taxon 272 str. F0290]
MKSFILFWFMGMSLCFASSIYSQEILMSIKAYDQTVKEVFNLIEQNSEYIIFYMDNTVDLNRKVKIHVKNQQIEKILDELFKGTDTAYAINDRQIVIYKKELSPIVREVTEIEQTYKISGKVVDSQGEPIIGANILEKGTTNGTITDTDGNFSLNVKSITATLVVSYIGYKTNEVKVVGGKSTIIALNEDSEALDEVVVVGYGTVKKKDLTGAVGQVTNANMRDLKISNATQALAGQLSGITVNQAVGTPGTAAVIRVRGAASITASCNPLYVVDGYPIIGDMSTINPNDIESMEVLKDASASAIYGSRASNGVVIVTTKSGKMGKTTVNFDAYFGFQTVAKTLNMLNAAQFMELNKEAFNAKYIANVPGAKVSDPVASRPSGYRYKYPDFYDDPVAVAKMKDTDWQKEIFRTAPMQNYQLGVSGGTAETKYSFSMGYFNQEGIVIHTGFERYSLRAKVDSKIHDRMTIGVNIAPTYTNSNEIRVGHPYSGVIIQAVAIAPWVPVRYENGTYASAWDYAGPGGDGITGLSNAVASATEITNKIDRLRVLGNSYIEIAFLQDKNLKLKMTLGADILSYHRDFFLPGGKIPVGGKPGLGTASDRRAESDAQKTFNYLNENTLTYTTILGGVHSLDAIVGFTLQKETWKRTYASGSDFPDDVIQLVSNAKVKSGSSSFTEWAMMSYLTRINYNYKNKYYITASIRSDGSSRFGRNNRYGNFPSASVMWRVSEEDFVKHWNIFSNLKMRASYGVTGNNALTNNYASVGTIATDNYVFGPGSGTIVSGAAMSTIANPDLTWEKATQFDLGLEAAFGDNRLSLGFDYYNRKTTDLLLDVPVPSITGFVSAYQNIGKVNNWGLEFNVGANFFHNKDFSWTMNANLSINRNKVIALGPSGDPVYYTAQTAGQGHIVKIGYPLGTFYGYDHLGVYMNKAMYDANPKEATSQLGDAMYRDVDGNHTIDANDRTEIGDNQPDFTYGWSHFLRYKNFDLSLLVQGAQGAQILNIGKRYYENLEGNQNQLKGVLKRWRSEADPGDGWMPRVCSNPTGQTSQVSSRWVEDGSYLRINNITLGYSLPKTFLNKYRMERARVYVSAQNPLTITKYSGFNPEVSSTRDGTGDTVVTPGGDHGQYPTSKSFSFGLNITF